MEEAPWKLEDSFSQREWDDARKEEDKKETESVATKTPEEVKSSELKSKVRSELNHVRNSALSATKAWGHGDTTARGLLSKLDGLHETKRNLELTDQAHVEALDKEMAGMQTKFLELEAEESRYAERCEWEDSERGTRMD